MYDVEYVYDDPTLWEEMIKPFIYDVTPGVTYLDTIEIYVCDYCGAFADTSEKINHHPTCPRRITHEN